MSGLPPEADISLVPDHFCSGLEAVIGRTSPCWMVHLPCAPATQGAQGKSEIASSGQSTNAPSRRSALEAVRTAEVAIAKGMPMLELSIRPASASMTSVDRPRVVILGGGFRDYRAARALLQVARNVTLIDRATTTCSSRFANCLRRQRAHEIFRAAAQIARSSSSSQ